MDLRADRDKERRIDADARKERQGDYEQNDWET